MKPAQQNSTIIKVALVFVFSLVIFVVFARVSSSPSKAAADQLNQNNGNYLQADQVSISLSLQAHQLPYGLNVGDYVDVITSFPIVNVDETYHTRLPNQIRFISLLDTGELVLSEPFTGQLEKSNVVPMGIVISPSQSQIPPRRTTQRTITEALVIHIEDQPEDSSGSPDDIRVTLAVSPQDALILTWLEQENMPTILALRGPNVAGSNIETEAVTLEYLLQRYDIDMPINLPFALENEE